MASARASAPLSISAAKLSGGAFKIGTRRGLLPSACETPENQTGGKLGERIDEEEAGTSIGMTVDGSDRFGKKETSGVCGGGRIKENSEASEDRLVCFCESAIKRFEPRDSNSTNDWGVISFGRSRNVHQLHSETRHRGRTFRFW